MLGIVLPKAVDHSQTALMNDQLCEYGREKGYSKTASKNCSHSFIIISLWKSGSPGFTLPDYTFVSRRVTGVHSVPRTFPCPVLGWRQYIFLRVTSATLLVFCLAASLFVQGQLRKLGLPYTGALYSFRTLDHESSSWRSFWRDSIYNVVSLILVFQ